MPVNFNYGYPTSGYYNAPMPDQLAQLRGAQMPMQQPMMAQPMQNMQQLQQTPNQTANNGINWVQGAEGAKAWMTAPGSTVLLMDSDGSSFYLKTVDASGMPQPLRTFDYVERTTTPKTPAEAKETLSSDYVTREEFQAVLTELEALKSHKCACGKKSVKESEADA